MSDQLVADELAIRQLVARYADAVVRYDEAAFRRTWTDDGEWQLLGRTVQGPDAIIALWKSIMDGLGLVVQLPHGGIVEIDGDSGTGRWSITEHIRTRDGAATLNLGLYTDSYRRVDGDWRFAQRRFDSLYMGPPDLSAEPLPRPEV